MKITIEPDHPAEKIAGVKTRVLSQVSNFVFGGFCANASVTMSHIVGNEDTIAGVLGVLKWRNEHRQLEARSEDSG